MLTLSHRVSFKSGQLAWCLSWQSNIHKATGLRPTAALCLIKVPLRKTWSEALLAHTSQVTLVKCSDSDVNGLQEVLFRGRNVAFCYWLHGNNAKIKYWCHTGCASTNRLFSLMLASVHLLILTRGAVCVCTRVCVRFRPLIVQLGWVPSVYQLNGFQDQNRTHFPVIALSLNNAPQPTVCQFTSI